MPFEDAKTISDVLRGIQQQAYVLPAIQREFVWDPDTQVTRLFDSLMRGYPIGAFLSWTVRPPLVGEFKFYGFMRDYHQLAAPHCPIVDLPVDQPVTAILDGQQRLTSLNIGLRGSHAKRRKYGWRDNLDAYPIRRLYLNLLSDAPENDLGMIHDFRFFEAAPERTLGEANHDQPPAFWYPVAQIFDEANPIVASKFLLQAGLGAAEVGAADRLGRLYEVVHNEKLIGFFRDDEQDIDRVLDIFIRVNSAGRPLSQSDLLLSIATAQFVERDARAAVHSLVDEMNKTDPGFDFDKDLVLKCGLALVDVSDFSFKVRNFSRANTALLDKNWDDIADVLRLAAGLLADFGFSSANLSANSVLVPLAYYLHHRGLGQSYRTAGSHDEDRRVLRQWVNRTLIKPGIWGSGFDTLLRDLRASIKEHGDSGFPTAKIEEAMRRRGKTTQFSAGEVVDLLATSYTQKGCFALLATMFPNVDTRNVFHIDHVFPQKVFTRKRLSDAGVPSDRIEIVRERRHRLANLQLLEGPVNVEKQATMPLQWARAKYLDGFDDYLARHDLPAIPSDLAHFESFYVERKKRLARRLAQVLGVDPAEAAAIVTPDEDESLSEDSIDE
jgi:hypothetical protein